MQQFPHLDSLLPHDAIHALADDTQSPCQVIYQISVPSFMVQAVPKIALLFAWHHYNWLTNKNTSIKIIYLAHFSWHLIFFTRMVCVYMCVWHDRIPRHRKRMYQCWYSCGFFPRYVDFITGLGLINLLKSYNCCRSNNKKKLLKNI